MNDLIKRTKAGCGSHSCRRHKPKGIGVNGPCRCWAMVDELADELERLQAVVDAAEVMANDPRRATSMASVHNLRAALAALEKNDE